MHSSQLLLFGIILFLSACSGSSGDSSVEDGNAEEMAPQFISTCDGDDYVSGTVSREFSDFSWNEPFAATADAHVRIQLTSFLFDGPSTTLLELDVKFFKLPFKFALCGNAEEIESMRQGMLAVSVDIYNHTGADARVGDLVNEYLNLIEGPTSTLEILVVGLEHCDAPNAGGFCTSNE